MQNTEIHERIGENEIGGDGDEHSRDRDDADAPQLEVCAMAGRIRQHQ